MKRLRIILAILITVSLAFAPVTSAWAMARMFADKHAAAKPALADHDGVMSDCMKAMQRANGDAESNDCPCCDTQNKAPCPDFGVCFAKCGAHVIAILVPSKMQVLANTRQIWPAAPEKPPDRSLSPPTEPPRA